MATFDQLSAEQRAIIELILQQGRSYEELADLLGLQEERVRELAQDALVTLAPVSADAVEEDWRSQLADYVLGQQSGAESTATRGHLRRSEAARTWTRSLMDSLETFYSDGDMPTVPDPERPIGRRGRAEAAAAVAEAPGRRELSPEAQAAVRRRRLLAGAAAVAVLIALGVLLWPIGVLTGNDDNNENASSGQAATGGRAAAGIAVFAQRNGQRQVIVQATLRPNRQREAYEVWLYNSPTDAKSLGAQVTDARGIYQGAGPLPTDYARFKFIDVSREPIDQNRGHSGNSVLRAPLPKLRAVRNAKKGQPVILGQVQLRPVQ
jgi:Anti-sigma-K factor rskA/Sigma-70, region 4